MMPRSKPLLPVRGLCSLLDKSQRQVVQLIEDGSLTWCWDVSLNPKHARKRELRILPAAAAEYLRGRPCSLEWPEVLRLLLRDDGPVILSKDIIRVLNITGEHAYALARRKLLGPCSTWHRGRGGCARFATKSFVEFLKSRRFP
jgi:hypothetical protein